MNLTSKFQKIKRKLTSRIQYKLFLITSFAVLIPVMLFGLISYNLSADKVKDDFIKTNLNTNAAIAQNIDEHYNGLQQQVFSLFTLHSDMEILLGSDSTLYTDAFFDAINQLNSYYNFHLSANNIFGLSLIDMDGKVKYTVNLDGKNTNLTSVSKEKWFLETIALDGRTLFREPHISEFLFYKTGEKPTEIVSIAQVIYDINYGSPLGLVLIDQAMDNFFGYTANTYLSPNHSLAVFSNTGMLVYTNTELTDAMTTAYHTIYTNDGKESVRTLEVESEDVLFISNPISQFGFRIISSMPVSDLKAQSSFLKDNTFLALGMLTLIILIASTVVSRVITNRIHNINHIFNEISIGNFDVEVPLSGEDEISEIADAFNHTIKNIQTLITDKYTANLLKQQAELDSLHSQINPHFLYNTLGSIRIVSDNGDNETASVMIQHLSDLLRYTLSKGSYIVRFEDELQHIKNYMAIMQERFSQQYTITYEIDDDAMTQSIPWMTLQPLVENAINHGLSGKKEDGLIRITAKTTYDATILYIYDNGTGIDTWELGELNKALKNNASSSSGENQSIGIYNVNGRIRMHFGDDYGLSLTSVYGEYTIAKITLPLTKGIPYENTVS